MIVAIAVATTIGALFLLSVTYRAGVRNGSIATLNEIRRAVYLAGLQGSVTGQRPIHEGQSPSN